MLIVIKIPSVVGC